MTEITMHSTTVAETLEIVAELKERLRLHEDFQFSFYQGRYDWETHEPIAHKTIFYFRDPAEATAFSLKYI